MRKQRKKHTYKERPVHLVKKKNKRPNSKVKFFENFLNGCSIVSKEAGFISNRHIEACRRTISRQLKTKKNKVVIHLSKLTPVTKKPLGSRMGKGKGAIYNRLFFIRSGIKLFSINGQQSLKFVDHLKSAAKKLPLDTCVKNSKCFRHNFWYFRKYVQQGQKP